MIDALKREREIAIQAVELAQTRYRLKVIQHIGELVADHTHAATISFIRSLENDGYANDEIQAAVETWRDEVLQPWLEHELVPLLNTIAEGGDIFAMPDHVSETT